MKLLALFFLVTSSVTSTLAQYYCEAFDGSVKDYNKITTGGSVAEGMPCCFPFFYKGVRYDSCTSFKHNREWCSVESVYQGNWGNCRNNDVVVNFPGGRSEDTCSPSGSLSYDFVTTGGTVAEDTPCCFPFTYNNVLYTECTSVNHNRPWCATGSVYQEGNKKWGNCKPGTYPTAYPGAPTPPTRVDYACNSPSEKSDIYLTFGGNALQGTPCCFPFTYRGVTYDKCTYADHKQPWCGVTELYESNFVWGNCLEKETNTPNPVPGNYPCNSFLNNARSPTRVTTGGSVPEGTPCCFPFVYNEVKYDDCTSVGHTRSWCAVDSVYRENPKLWGNCVTVAEPAIPSTPVPTSSYDCNGKVSTNNVTTGGTVSENSPCCFPFNYRGKPYYNCISVNHNQLWCSVDSKYNQRWGNCRASNIPADIRDEFPNHDDPYYQVPDEKPPQYYDADSLLDEPEEPEEPEDFPQPYPFPMPSFYQKKKK